VLRGGGRTNGSSSLPRNCCCVETPCSKCKLKSQVAARDQRVAGRARASIEKPQQTASGKVAWRAHYRDPDGNLRSKSFERESDAQRFLTMVESAKAAGSRPFLVPDAAATSLADFHGSAMGASSAWVSARIPVARTAIRWNLFARKAKPIEI